MTAPLTPPDPLRCQAEITTYRPFIMGGNVHQTARCDNRAAYIATERKPGADGRIGAMSVCVRCQAQMETQMPGVCSYEAADAEAKP